MPLILIIILILGLLLLAIYLILNPEHKILDESVRASSNMDFISLQNGFVHYEIEGEKDRPLVVLVHGFSTPAYTWDPNIQALIEAGFSVLRFDLYGRGYSDRPKTAYNLNLFVNQLEGLLDSLKINQPIHLLGLSMGGPIVVEFANRHPESIHSLTLVDPLVTNIFQGNIFPLTLPGIGEYLMAVFLEPFTLPKSQCGDLVHPENFPDWEKQYKVQTQYKGFGRAILSTMREISKMDTVQLYKTLAGKGLPTLIVRGRQDQTISAEDIVLLREMLPNHQFQEIPDAGHIPHYEQPQIVNPLLIQFFKSVP